MDFAEYKEMIEKVHYTDTLEYLPAITWLHPERLPVGVISLGNADCGIIKIPGRVASSAGIKVPVIAIGKNVFSGRSDLTDIVLPQSIERLPEGAFKGCTGLKRIIIPRNVTAIKVGTFAGCDQLEDIYYEGTSEEWDSIDIAHRRHEIEFGALIPGTPINVIKAERMLHVPGNEALFTANIHFYCKLSEDYPGAAFAVKTADRDITDLFRTM